MTSRDKSMNAPLQPTRSAGFTLIELMITVIVATILLAIAIPSYRSEVMSSRRTDAKSAVLDLAAREQRYYSLQNSFTNSFISLGYATTNPSSLTVGSGYYAVSLSAPAPAAGSPPTFTVTATATGSQTADSSCQTYTVDNTGLQKAFDGSSNDTTTTCWQ